MIVDDFVSQLSLDPLAGFRDEALDREGKKGKGMRKRKGKRGGRGAKEGTNIPAPLTTDPARVEKQINRTTSREDNKNN